MIAKERVRDSHTAAMFITRTGVALLVLTVLGTPSDAQQDGSLYAGGTVTGLTQTRLHKGSQLGGTTWNGSVFVGGWISPRVAISFETSFG